MLPLGRASSFAIWQPFGKKRQGTAQTGRKLAPSTRFHLTEEQKKTYPHGVDV
jgi:hypothetical protein